MALAQMDAITIGGVILGVVSLAVGPGGVFYFLVKKGLNGTVAAIERTDKTVGKMSALQNMDHDRITQAVTTLEQIKNENHYYHKLVDEHTKAIVAVETRCEVLHRDHLKGTTEKGA